MTQPATMALSAVPTGYLFTFDNGASMFKLTAKAGMGPQTVLHCVAYGPTGPQGEPFTVNDPAQLAGQVLAAPDPAGPAAGIPAPTVQPAPTLATAAQEAAANAAVVGAFPAATLVQPALSNTPPGLQAPVQTVGATQAAVTPAPSQGTSTSVAGASNSAISRLAHSRMQHFGQDRVPNDPRAHAITSGLGSVAQGLLADVGSGLDVIAGIDALLLARDAFIRAALAQ